LRVAEEELVRFWLLQPMTALKRDLLPPGPSAAASTGFQTLISFYAPQTKEHVLIAGAGQLVAIKSFEQLRDSTLSYALAKRYGRTNVYQFVRIGGFIEGGRQRFGTGKNKQTKKTKCTCAVLLDECEWSVLICIEA
jgi:hypothetical protein